MITERINETKRIDFRELFGNSNPVEIEIGCGKGKFLLARAAENPNINFLGIDRVAKWMKIGLERSEKRKITNLHFMKTEAREWLAQIPRESIAAFHIYFPDPWPKRRHRPRRLVQKSFLVDLYDRLSPGGFLEIATDDVDYFSHMKMQFEDFPRAWKEVRPQINQRFINPEHKTNYELKYEAQGKPLYYLEARK